MATTRGKTREPNRPRQDDNDEREWPTVIENMKLLLNSTLRKLNYYHKSTRDILEIL